MLVSREELRPYAFGLMYLILSWYGMWPFMVMRLLQERMSKVEQRRARTLRLRALVAGALSCVVFAADAVVRHWPAPAEPAEAILLVACLGTALFSWMRLDMLLRAAEFRRPDAGEVLDRVAESRERPGQG